MLDPVGGYIAVIDNVSGCPAGQENPLIDADAFSHTNGAFAAEEFDLSAYSGQTIQIAFHVAWDCGECSDGANEGWFVDDVIAWEGTAVLP